MGHIEGDRRLDVNQRLTPLMVDVDRVALTLTATAEVGVGPVVDVVEPTLDVTLPARFLWQAYRAVLSEREGEDAVPPVSPFDKPRLVWRLMRRLPALLDSSTFAPLARFLSKDVPPSTPPTHARKIFSIFIKAV